MEDIVKLTADQIPKTLLEIPQPPKQLFMRGELPDPGLTYLAVVGSRNFTHYGKDACEKLIKGLKGYPIVIVSGLALGIDTIAHRAALSAGLITIAMPGSGLDNSALYPKTNVKLAQEIVDAGGCLLSEMKPDEKSLLYSFPQRNRLMAGLCKATLVIEAAEKSGTLITARMALDYNRDVLVVPGSINSDTSKGTNNLLRLGATPITTSEELLDALGFQVEKKQQSEKERYADCGKDEMKIINLLREEPLPRDELIRASGFDTGTANALISIMEIKELIKEEYGEIRKI